MMYPFPDRSHLAQAPLRLNSLVNPHAPTDGVMEALASLDVIMTPDEEIAHDLRRRLGQLAGVDERWVVLAAGIDALYEAIVSWRLDAGPVAVFPPTHLAELQRVLDAGGEVQVVPRSSDFSLGLTAIGRRFPTASTSVVMSPNDPSGTMIDVHELVRLARQSALVVIDERHGAYTPRSAAPFTREFDNLIVLQSMEWWAGLASYPVAWAICPPSIGREIAASLGERNPDRMALVAARATLDDWAWLRRTLLHVTAEKGRLFRQLRKLNMLHTPYPSWAGFVLTRFARGGVDFFVPRLEDRGIQVHTLDRDILPDHIRVSAVSAEATDQLKRALIDIALEL